MSTPTNRYCQRLGVAVPRLEDVVLRPGMTLSQLAAIVLLEEGGPLPLREIAARLSRAGLPARVARADLVGALRKAWHGQPPLVRDTDDRVALDLLSRELRHLTFEAGLHPHTSSPPAPVEVPQPGDDEPLTQEEVTAAFGGRYLYGYSSVRRAAAVLEAWGSPQTLDDVAARLSTLTEHAGRIDPSTVLAWRTDLIAVEPVGLLRLNPASDQVMALRRDIRRKAAGSLRAASASREIRSRLADGQKRLAREGRTRMAAFQKTRRALVHAVPSGHPPCAAAVVDVGSRSVDVFVREDLGKLADHLEQFDFLAGVDLRATLRALDVDPDRWWLAELRPVRKTFRPTDQSKPISVTLAAAVKATTGVANVPADSSAWERRLDGKRLHDVAGRIGHEARTLCQLYEYGAFHGGVRLRSRPGDHLLPVEWALEGQPDLYSTLDAAVRGLSPLDLVLGKPPELGDPWRRAVRADIVDVAGPHLVVRTADAINAITTHDVFAAKVVDPAAADQIRFRHRHRGVPGNCQLTVTLDGIRPPIWRRLVVPTWVTLEKLHEFLQTALGWTNSHLHMFRFGDERVGTPYELPDLDELYTRSDRILHVADVIALGHLQFAYDYDFGDGWTHTIQIEKVADDYDGPDLVCLDGARACPPEDCGGVGGYERLLEVLFDPGHDEFESMREWVGPGFEPERFNLQDVNRNLRLW